MRPELSFSRGVRRTVAFAALTAVAMVAGCNAILGNDPGALRQSPVGGADAGGDGSSPRPGVSCASSEKVCSGACVPKFNTGFSCASETSCDPCPQPPHTTPICNGSVCGVACKKGYENCDTSPDCEADLAKSPTCGSCNGVCSNFCSPDGFGSFRCTDSCAAGLTGCGAQCVDLQTTTTSCGTCNQACPEPLSSTAFCRTATCGFDCSPGFHACGPSCVSDGDVAACGPSCSPCGVARSNMTISCSQGACQEKCRPGFEDCNAFFQDGCEADLFSDSANCGACGHACLPGPPMQSFGGGNLKPLGGPLPPSGLCACTSGICQPCVLF